MIQSVPKIGALQERIRQRTQSGCALTGPEVETSLVGIAAEDALVQSANLAERLGL